MPHRWMHRKAGIWGSRAWPAGCVTGAALSVAVGLAIGLGGCATQYRPVVAAINPVGPAGQPTKYAFVISDPNELNTTSALNGLLTVVDFSGDTILATPTILPRPTYLAVQASGATGFVINAENSLNSVPLGPSVITSQVVQTTLPTGANPPTLSAFTLGTTAQIFVPEASLSAVSIFSTPSPALRQEIAVGANPVYVVGSDNTPRGYVISNGNGTGSGQVAAIEASSLSVSSTFAVGVNPVYGVETTDVRRAFILNKGSGTVSVINVTNNAIDNANPTINLNNANGNGITGLEPVWADFATATNQLVVVSQRAGDANGYLSIINIPLCSAVAQPTNPSCDATNPIDGVGFGQVLATVPVGVNPTQVAALVDGTQAFVANSGDPFTSPEIEGTVSAINLVSGQVTATVTGVTSYAGGAADPITVPTCNVIAAATAATQACVYGHPTTIAATTGSPTGKVYVTSPDSNYMTVIETDTDTVVTHINLQGIGVRVQMSAR